MIARFHDRPQAGHMLAGLLEPLRGRSEVVVFALPRGGVPVAAEICRLLDLPLEVYVVRKLGVPGNEELAMGAIAPGGVRVMNENVLRLLELPQYLIDRAAAREEQELERRQRAYRDDRPPPDIAGRTIVLVDDGLATGATMRAAVQAVRKQGAARVIVAVPVASPVAREEFAGIADEFVSVLEPDPFYAIGYWYDEFPQVTDEQVREGLSSATTCSVNDCPSDATRLRSSQELRRISEVLRRDLPGESAAMERLRHDAEAARRAAVEARRKAEEAHGPSAKTRAAEPSHQTLRVSD